MVGQTGGTKEALRLRSLHARLPYPLGKRLISSRPFIHTLIYLIIRQYIHPSIYLLIYLIIHSSIHSLKQRIWPVIPVSQQSIYTLSFSCLQPPGYTSSIAQWAADLDESLSINISIDQTLENICLCLAVPPSPSFVRLFPVHPSGQSVPLSSSLAFVHLSDDPSISGVAIMLAHHHLTVSRLSSFQLSPPFLSTLSVSPIPGPIIHQSFQSILTWLAYELDRKVR